MDEIENIRRDICNEQGFFDEALMPEEVATLFAAIDELRRERDRLRKLIREAHVTMNHAEVFINSREKIHKDGQDLYRDLLHRMEDAIENNALAADGEEQ